MSKVNNPPETVTEMAMNLVKEYISELQWAMGGIEAALNLMYRGLSDKSENDEAIAAVGMLRDYFSTTTQKVQNINDQFERQVLQG